jgi:hypothetical protein
MTANNSAKNTTIMRECDRRTSERVAEKDKRGPTRLRESNTVTRFQVTRIFIRARFGPASF